MEKTRQELCEMISSLLEKVIGTIQAHDEYKEKFWGRWISYAKPRIVKMGDKPDQPGDQLLTLVGTETLHWLLTERP